MGKGQKASMSPRRGGKALIERGRGQQHTGDMNIERGLWGQRGTRGRGTGNRPKLKIIKIVL